MKIKLPHIREDQKTPLVQMLLRIIQIQAENIAFLKDEIAKLKGQKPRPKIPKSKVSNDAKSKKKDLVLRVIQCLLAPENKDERNSAQLNRTLSLPARVSRAMKITLFKISSLNP